MGDPTATLQALRRNVALKLQMPFFRRYPAGYSEVDASSTTTKIIDTSLVQKTGFWNGSWFYRITSQESSIIRAYSKDVQTFQIEVPLAATPSAGDDYEIHTIWNAIDIHSAINDAIRSVQRYFPEVVSDKTMVLEEDKLDYSLASLATAPWIIAKLYLENRTARRGVVQSATSTTLVVENSSILSDVTSSWYVSIYAGTGSGQLRAVSSVASATINVAAWTTTPDGTSKYCLWNPDEQLHPWNQLTTFAVDTKEWPTMMYLQSRIPSYYGMRLRIEYMAFPAALSLETDTTIVPVEYVASKATSLLYGRKLSNTKIDRDTYYAESERYREMAESLLVLPHMPDVSMRTMNDRNLNGYIEDDPLSWY